MFSDSDVAAMDPSTLLTLLPGIDPAGLDAPSAVTYLIAVEKAIAHLHGRQATALVAVASAVPVVDEFTLLDGGSGRERAIRVEDAVRDEVAAALRWSPVTTQQRIDVARWLAGPLVDTRAALLAGDITLAHARIVCEAAEQLPAERVPAFPARVLTTARRSTLSRTRAAARAAVHAVDPDGQATRRRAARCTRDVWVWDELDGLSTLMARLATEDAHALLAHVNAYAATEHPSLDPAARAGERRADALRALVLNSKDSDGRDRPVVRAHVDLVIDLRTLLVLRDADAPGTAELIGTGPVSSDVVRDLLADPDVAVTIRRLVADPVTGHLLDHGRRTYAVPAPLRDYLIARDRTCRFPGCSRQAARCQLDHVQPWDDGGTTSPANLGALCVRHHQVKTHCGWRITDSQPDGTCTWHSPHGREYHHDPPRY